jgi:hypothetical protein
MQPITRPGRPRGITVVSLLLALQGLLELALAGLALSGVAMLVQSVGEGSLALGLLVLLLAWGVWMLKHWAFWGVPLLELLLLGAAIVNLLEMPPASRVVMVPVVIGGMIIPVVVLLCFWRDRRMRSLWRP